MELTVILTTVLLVGTTWALARLVSRLKDTERQPEGHS
jgi:hypothetical protein